MTKKELLTNYRSAVIEVEELRKQLQRVGTNGCPAGVRTMQTDRISRCTNNHEAASIQLADGLESLLSRKEEDLASITPQVEALLACIRDFRTYLVIHHYYRLGRTDEQVARAMSISRGRVNQLRLEYLESA